MVVCYTDRKITYIILFPISYLLQKSTFFYFIDSRGFARKDRCGMNHPDLVWSCGGKTIASMGWSRFLQRQWDSCGIVRKYHYGSVPSTKDEKGKPCMVVHHAIRSQFLMFPHKTMPRGGGHACPQEMKRTLNQKNNSQFIRAIHTNVNPVRQYVYLC